MTTLSLSPSRASDFRTCPQLFKYRAIDRLAEPASEPAVRGSIVHLALERLFEEPAGRRDLTVALDTLDTAWVDYLDDDLRAELFATEAAELESQQTCERFVRNYFELETPSALEPAGREIRLSAEIGGVAVRGILDRVDRSAEGDWIISDYKTGRTPALDRSVRNFFGLEAYAALFHEVFGVVPRQVRLLYLDSPDVYVLDQTLQSVTNTKRLLGALGAAIATAIERDDWRPRTSALCDWCSFKDRCPAWATSLRVDTGDGNDAQRRKDPQASSSPSAPVSAA